MRLDVCNQYTSVTYNPGFTVVNDVEHFVPNGHSWVINLFWVFAGFLPILGHVLYLLKTEGIF